jgi:arylsulfatase
MAPIENGDNIVLLTIDSLRADHCGYHGYSESTTPALDKLAEDGVSFKHAIAPGPRTPDSVPSFFTVTDPGVVGDSFKYERETIRDHILAHSTIPERLSERGYTTAAFTPNPYTSRYFGYDQLFDHFEDFMNEDQSEFLFQRLLEGGSTADTAVRMLISGIQRQNVFKSWEAYYDRIIEWVGETEEPYFVWVFLMDCHIPYLSGSGAQTQSWWESYYANLRWYWNDKSKRFNDSTHKRLVTAYDDAVRYTDRFLDRLRTDIDDATFVVTADHGEAFFDHGAYGHPPNHFYEENLHVPLVVHNGETKGTVDDVVSLRCLPELLTGNYETSNSVSSVATASSLGLPKFGIRSKNWGYITSEDDTESSQVELDFSSGDCLADSDEEAIKEGCWMLADQYRESIRERARIKDVTWNMEKNRL